MKTKNRTSRYTIVRLASIATLLTGVACAAPLKVLLITGDNNHDWRPTTPVIKEMLEQTGRFDVVVTEHPADLKPAALAPYDVIFSHWNSWKNKDGEKAWSPELRKAYLDFVRNGKGHVVFHAGSSSFFNDPEFQQLYGATWKLGQTGHGPQHEFPVRPTAVDHPITRGLAEFRTTDELWHRPGLQPGVTVLAEAFSAANKRGSGQWEPSAMVNAFGKGRNFVLLLGHGPDNMRSPSFRALLTRGTEWAASGAVTLPLPEELATASTPTPETLAAVAGYQFGQSRKALAAVEQQAAAADPGTRAKIAAALATLLEDPKSTADAKRWICGQLGRVGTATEVPAVAGLLGDTNLATEARFALEAIPGEEALRALRDGTKLLQGRQRAGLLASLGLRRDANAVPLLATYVLDDDNAVAAAALGALGKIATPEAVRALEQNADKIPQSLRIAHAHALLDAAVSLRERGATAEARRVLTKVAAPEQPTACRNAAYALLVSLGGPGTGDILLRALQGTDRRLQSTIIGCARNVPGKDLTRALAETLPSLPTDLQVQTIGILAEREGREMIPALLAAADDDDPAIRIASGFALARVGDRAVIPTVLRIAATADGQDREGLRAAFSRMTGAGIDDGFSAALRSDDPATCLLAIQVLELRAAKGAAKSVLAFATHADAAVRKAALQAVGTIGTAELAPALIRLLDSAASSDRRAIESALEAMACHESTGAGIAEAIRKGMGDAPPARRMSLMAVLGSLGLTDLLPYVETALKDPDADIRRAAVKALSAWPDTSVLPRLLVLAKSAKGDPEGILALRGAASHLEKAADLSVDKRVAYLKESFTLAARPEELRILLAAAATIPGNHALGLISAYVDHPAVQMEALQALGRVIQTLPADRQPRNLAKGAVASSPDGLNKDGASHGDAAGIDGNLDTYWDEQDGKPLYRYVVTFPAATPVSALRITGFVHHQYAPKDFEILCDDKVVREIRNAAYDDNKLFVAFPPSVCTALELRITGYYTKSPAIRELEIYNLAEPAQPGRE